jgi:hypothetical protein
MWNGVGSANPDSTSQLRFPAPGDQTVRASIITAEPLVVGKPVAALLQLQRPDGDPVMPVDLIETHTKKIHLLIIDSSLTDYHHEHPVPTRNPGEYTFSFTPKNQGAIEPGQTYDRIHSDFRNTR